MDILEIRNLHVSVADKQILKGIDLTIKENEICRLFVLPEYQGKGYGRLLLDHAVAYAKEQKYNKICLDTRK